jgi:hypothetical protein
MEKNKLEQSSCSFNSLLNSRSTIPNTQNTLFHLEWLNPTLIEANEIGDTVEFVYKQIKNNAGSWNLNIFPTTRVFKIIFSCKDGKWNKSEPIYGEIIPPKDETFRFDV